MPIQVETRDCAALTDADLDEMASMGGAFDIGVLSKAKEDWVLCTTARIDDKLHGFTFSTLERIGGTPCVLLGLMSVKRTVKRDQVLKGLMGEAFHRALMAFPDEDVVVGSRFVTADALEAFKQVDELIPRPGHRAVGEERAWGRRLAKRFGVDAQLRRAVVRGQVQRPERLPRPRDAEAGEDQARARRAVRHGQPEEGRLARRPRLGDGRRPGQAGRSLSDVDARSTVEAVIRRRRMTREFSTEPLDPQLVDDLVDTARRAPSAGYSQGVHFVVLTGERCAKFWQTTDAESWFAETQDGVLLAPVIVLPFADPAAYTSRYTETDKAGHGLEIAANWPVPFWLTDTAMAVQNLLLLVEARRLGALYFGIFRNADVLLADLGVPEGMLSVGAVAIGHRAATDRPSGSATTRPRRATTEVVHHNRW